jgi:hypothetical protein
MVTSAALRSSTCNCSTPTSPATALCDSVWEPRVTLQSVFPYMVESF